VWYNGCMATNVALTRLCRTCDTFFAPVSNNQTECKQCKADYDRINWEVNKRRRQSQMMFRRVGITLDQYDVILASQNGVCAICGTAPIIIDTRNGEPRRLHVDHDHLTNSIRGILCHGCNTGMGGFHDSPKLLRDAANYLERKSTP
jgi:hypothetical protein